MRQLFLFIYRLRVFFVFVVLELIAAWLIIQNNNYQGFALLSTSNRVVGGVYDMGSGITGYFDLRKQNELLAQENARLSSLLHNLDTLQEKVGSLDTALTTSYQFIPAHVVNNSIIFNDNYITIDKGGNRGIEPGMGVISTQGIVGKVKVTSGKFATIYSILHSDVTVSAQTRKQKILCTVKWNTGETRNSYDQAELLYVDMHHNLTRGDTIETSGYNAVYPEGILIGVVDTVFQKKSEMFQQIKINLSTDFSSLKHVYVIRNLMKQEKDSVEDLSQENYLY